MSRTRERLRAAMALRGISLPIGKLWALLILHIYRRALDATHRTFLQHRGAIVA